MTRVLLVVVFGLEAVFSTLFFDDDVFVQKGAEQFFELRLPIFVNIDYIVGRPQSGYKVAIALGTTQTEGFPLMSFNVAHPSALDRRNA